MLARSRCGALLSKYGLSETVIFCTILVLGLTWPMSSRDGSQKNALRASFPQLPSISTASGIHDQFLAPCFVVYVLPGFSCKGCCPNCYTRFIEGDKCTGRCNCNIIGCRFFSVTDLNKDVCRAGVGMTYIPLHLSLGDGHDDKKDVSFIWLWE